MGENSDRVPVTGTTNTMSIKQPFCRRLVPWATITWRIVKVTEERREGEIESPSISSMINIFGHNHTYGDSQLTKHWCEYGAWQSLPLVIYRADYFCYTCGGHLWHDFLENSEGKDVSVNFTLQKAMFMVQMSSNSIQLVAQQIGRLISVVKINQTNGSLFVH